MIQKKKFSDAIAANISVVGELLPITGVDKDGFLPKGTLVTAMTTNKEKGHPYLRIKFGKDYAKGTLFLNLTRNGTNNTLIVTFDLNDNGQTVGYLEVAFLGKTESANISYAKFIQLENGERWLEFAITNATYMDNARALHLLSGITAIEFSDAPLDNATSIVEGTIRKL